LVVEIAAGVIELRRVENIECVSVQLKCEAFGQVQILLRAEVNRSIAGGPRTAIRLERVLLNREANSR
jgi:hypothetical protein